LARRPGPAPTARVERCKHGANGKQGSAAVCSAPATSASASLPDQRFRIKRWLCLVELFQSWRREYRRHDDAILYSTMGWSLKARADVSAQLAADWASCGFPILRAEGALDPAEPSTHSLSSVRIDRLEIGTEVRTSR
jgi:hypothetical protein